MSWPALPPQHLGAFNYTALEPQVLLPSYTLANSIVRDPKTKEAFSLFDVTTRAGWANKTSRNIIEPAAFKAGGKEMDDWVRDRRQSLEQRHETQLKATREKLAADDKLNTAYRDIEEKFKEITGQFPDEIKEDEMSESMFEAGVLSLVEYWVNNPEQKQK